MITPKPYIWAPQTESQIRTTVTALVTLLLLLIWTGMVVGVFILVTNFSAKKTLIDSTLYGLLGTIFGTETTLLTAAVGYWVGTSAGAKSTTEALQESNRSSSAALATIAGTGTGGAPQPVEVVNRPDAPVPTTTKDEP